MAAKETHWTSGAPKWAAVLILGAASTTAIGWAIGRGGDSWRTPNRAGAQPPTVAANTWSPSSQPSQQSPAAPPAFPAPAPSATITPAGQTTPVQQPRSTTPLRKLINVNTAAQGELELLPGIGPALAKRIIEHRATKGPFRRVDDLDAVKGIGPKILERLRPQVTVE